MDANTILVTASGSSIGLEVAKSLRRWGGAGWRIVGSEVSWWGRSLAARYCDEVLELPRGDDPAYVDCWREMVERLGARLVFVNTEPELEALAACRADLPVAVSCPPAEHLACCLDKQRLHAVLEGSGLIAGTRAIRPEDDPREAVGEALEQLGRPCWLRCATGPRGRGSIPIESPDEGAFWISYWRRRDEAAETWLAHEYLPGRNFNWTSLWYQGELITSACGERLQYFLSQVAVSGITGNVSHCRLVPSGACHEMAVAAVRALGGQPHGFYSVDLREARDGAPRVTEINGRNAFRPLLYTQGGANFPGIWAQLVLAGERPKLPQRDAPEVGWEMIRGMDFEPLFRKGSP